MVCYFFPHDVYEGINVLVFYVHHCIECCLQNALNISFLSLTNRAFNLKHRSSNWVYPNPVQEGRWNWWNQANIDCFKQRSLSGLNNWLGCLQRCVRPLSICVYFFHYGMIKGERRSTMGLIKLSTWVSASNLLLWPNYKVWAPPNRMIKINDYDYDL